MQDKINWYASLPPQNLPGLSLQQLANLATESLLAFCAFQ